MLQSDPAGVRRHPFTPWQAVPEQLARTLVGRDAVLSDLVGLLGRPPDCASNHTILIGPRGIGKTHLLSLIRHYVSGRLAPPFAVSADLSVWTPVLFAEEEHARQNSVTNFLLAVMQKLREADIVEPLWQLPAELSGEPDPAVCECCFERLRRGYEEKARRVLLLIDNLQKVFAGWSQGDHERLRAFLSGQGFVLIIGSAPSVFKQIMGQRAAFHDFFEIRPVGDLTRDEVLEFVGKWFAEEGRQGEFAERYDELARKLPAIQTLTGGNPRLILFVSRAATRTTFLEIEAALSELMEELREYFIRRFDDLPPQTGKVLDTLVEMSGPATPTEIAREARLSLPVVNAQLRRLKQQHYVRPIKMKRRRTTRYDIPERLFRIWRQTASVAGQQRFRFLVDFLRLYFTPEEIRSLYREHARSLRHGVDAKGDHVLHHVEEALGRLHRGAESLATAEKAYELALEDPNVALRVVSALQQLGRHEAALARIETALANQQEPRLLEQKVWCLVRTDRTDEALAVVAQTAEAGASQRDVCHARGDILLLAGRYAEALASLDAGLAIDPDDWNLAVDREVALACLGRHGKRMEALPVALAAVPIPTSSAPTTCEYILEVGERALTRGETSIGLSLGRAVLAMEAWHRGGWYGPRLGAFLRHVLAQQPHALPEVVDWLREAVSEDNVLRLLAPFVQAVEYARTGDVAILEEQFPETREIVAEIAGQLGRSSALPDGEPRSAPGT